MGNPKLTIVMTLELDDDVTLSCVNTTFPITTKDLTDLRRFTPKPGHMFLGVLATQLIESKTWLVSFKEQIKDNTTLTDALGFVAEHLGGTKRIHSGRTRVINERT